jgi:peroxiredoxin
VTALYQRSIDEISAEGLAERALGVGATAPEIVLPGATGAMVDLADLRASGPVVATFYRGSWCPYCTLELRAYSERTDEFTAAGAHIVAISPQLPDRSLTLVEREALPFHVLSDVGNVVAGRFGIVHAVPAEISAVHAANGLDVAGGNAQDPADVTLPLPATYVIDTQGIIRFAEVSADYRTRADPDAVLAAVTALA